MAHTISSLMLLLKSFLHFKNMALHFTLNESSPRFIQVLSMYKALQPDPIKGSCTL